MEELSIPYEIQVIKFDDVKKKPFTDINPNGRCPGTYRYIYIKRLLSILVLVQQNS